MSIQPVQGPRDEQRHEPANELSDIDAMKMLGDLKRSVHNIAVSAANFEPVFTPSQVLAKTLLGGVVLSLVIPPAAPAILATAAVIGVASALFEAAATSGINAAGSFIARMTEDAPPQNQNPQPPHQ